MCLKKKTVKSKPKVIYREICANEVKVSRTLLTSRPLTAMDWTKKNHKNEDSDPRSQEDPCRKQKWQSKPNKLKTWQTVRRQKRKIVFFCIRQMSYVKVFHNRQFVSF